MYLRPAQKSMRVSPTQHQSYNMYIIYIYICLHRIWSVYIFCRFSIFGHVAFPWKKKWCGLIDPFFLFHGAACSSWFRYPVLQVLPWFITCVRPQGMTVGWANWSRTCHCRYHFFWNGGFEEENPPKNNCNAGLGVILRIWEVMMWWDCHRKVFARIYCKVGL